ncbi:MAG TPA: hypothetical protein VMY37_03580, partial [Thermoguttaceae bacterium]|nr:hypothetical protein [Thermoguttaceae bacterium]
MNGSRTNAVLTLAVVAMAALVLTTSANAAMLLYEPFDYGDVRLNGQGGALGTTGTWVTNDTGDANGWNVHPEGQLTGIAVGGTLEAPILNMFDGTVANLPTKGGFAGMSGPEDRGLPYGTDGGTGNLDAHIGIDPSVTATFMSGTTTWF